MPAVAENLRKWSEHNWEHGGHRWSPGGTAAGTDMMWWRSVRPRIHAHLPAGTLLEIAPGFGRWTGYLLRESQRFFGVDVTERCIDVCRERFADASLARFFVNDGESLPMVPDASIDFAFSLDSLVHVEAPQIRRYAAELARTLTPGGAAFLHHSNLGAYAERSGDIPAYVRERHWRARSMSARTFREACRDAGLHCTTQEIINWIGRDADVDHHRLPGAYIALTDCFSVCTRRRSPRPTEVYVNTRFVEEWRQLIDLTRLYGDDTPVAGMSAARQPTLRTKLGRGRHLAHGWVFARREPIGRALRRGHCPDCGAAAAVDGRGVSCRACDAHYVWC
jgi:ubiquinone/menaquinone biosynthesis C-methylase UbiE